MKIYEVRTHPNYRRLTLDRRKFADGKAMVDYMQAHLRFKGAPISDWQPPEVKPYFPAFPAPDIWNMDFAMGTAIAFGPKASEFIEPLLHKAGQVLFLPFKDETFLIVNILACQDCVDEDKSNWHIRHDGSRGHMQRPFFVPEEVPGSSLFKIPQALDRIYVWEEDSSNSDDEFKACVEANGLTGLYFDPVWSDEEGLIPYVLRQF